MKKTICLVDSNSIGNANHNSTVLTVGEMQTQAIFGTLKSARKFLVDFEGCGFIWLWDSRAKWRYDLYPDYKSNRKPKDAKQEEHKKQYHQQRTYIELAFSMLGVSQMWADYYEADDLAGWLSGSLTDRSVILITGDMDWAQLVNDRVMFFDPIRDKKINSENFFSMTGYRTPRYFLDGKCLMGDSSDCITGVGGIGKTTAPEFVAEFGGVEGFFHQVESGLYKPRLKKEINLAEGEGRDRYWRNFKLMSLIGRDRPEKSRMERGAFNRQKFMDFCYDLNFKSITDDFDGWIEPFERAWNERGNQ